MKRTHRTDSARYRWGALVLAGAVAGSILISPVSAHIGGGFGHLVRHLKKRVAPRVAYGVDNNDTRPTTSPTVLVQATIDAPSEGFLIIHGSSDVYNSSGPEPVLSCFIRLDSTDVESSRRNMELNHTTNSEENCETHTVVPVRKGSHNVQLRSSTSFNDTNFDNKVVSAVWIPFGGSGGKPRGFTPL